MVDGFVGQEGSFAMCTAWYIEALSRAGEYDEAVLKQARRQFDDFVGFASKLSLYAEEIAPDGSMLGSVLAVRATLDLRSNFPQAFSHVSLISAAFSLDRALDRSRGR